MTKTETETNPTAATTPKRPALQSKMPEKTDKVVTSDLDGAYAEHMAKLGPGFRRRPFGTMQQKLAYPERPGFHRHWFNDDGDRVLDANRNGYVHVEENGVPVELGVGSKANGQGMKAYLMEQPLFMHEENLAYEQREVDEIDEAIRGGAIASKEDDGRYIPDSGIHVEND